MRRCEVGVQAHVLVLRRDLEQREDDQDEDEVNLLIRISNKFNEVQKKAFNEAIP
jgi:hypothetical protein